MATKGEPASSSEQDFETLLSECIEAFGADGAEGVARVCAGRPDIAERLRERLASLQRLGLLGEEREDARPETIGRYRIERRLGQGGMAVVYLARDPRNGRHVALKAASTPLLAGDRGRARFEREVRAFEGLRHPNVVPILDSGEAGGRPFFTMEYVEGATLGQVIDALRRSEKPLDQLTGRDVGAVVAQPADLDAWDRSYFETVTRLVLDVAEALDHLHAHNVVHRDVKPSNVLVGPDGRARLFDLGLAHVDDQPALTRSGDFAGTPYYVSPEQVAHGPVDLDARADVYSLGVTLFELLTLRRPFEGRTTAQVLRRIQVDEPPLPRRLNPLIPRGLELVCLTAMEKNPARRYGSARELADDLRRFLAFLPVRARPVGTLTRGVRFVRRNPARAAALGLALLVVVGLPVGLAVANAAVRRQRDLAAENATEARRQAARNRLQTEFLVELYELTGAAARGDGPLPASEFLERSAERIDVQFEDEPLVRATLEEAIGKVYASLGMYDRAVYQLDRSFAILQRELGEPHVDVARALHGLAAVHLEGGNAENALALGQRSLNAFEEAGAARSSSALECRITLSDTLARLGRSDEAYELLAHTDTDAPDAADLRAEVEERLGRLSSERGELEEAVTRLDASLRMREAAAAPDLAAVARTCAALAEAHALAGEDERARPYAQRAEAIRAALTLDGAGVGGMTWTAPSLDEALERFLLLPPWLADFERAFQGGITALQSGEPERAIALFERCLEWAPEHPACAYNIACSHAQLGQLEQALDWLERATERGLAADPARWEALQKDPDLDPIRSDPRCAAAIERSRRLRGEVQRYVSTPALRLPESAGPWPLLVVLHADGSTKDEVLSGPWARIADELGFALLAPSAPRLLRGDMTSGLRWMEDVRDLARRPWHHERRIIEQVQAFCDTTPIDRRRVFVAGEREAAPLAFDLALRAPGLFRGAILRDGTMLPQVDGERARRAAALQVEVHVRIDDPSSLPARPSPDELARHAREVEEWLAAHGLAGSVRIASAETGDPATALLSIARGLQDRRGN